MSWFGTGWNGERSTQYLTTEQLVSTELPESIGKLTNVRDFCCNNNQLTSEFPRIFLALPECSTQYKNSLETNFPGIMFRPRPCVHRFTAPPTEPPQEIAGNGIGAIKKWFNDNHAAAGQAGAAAASSWI